MVCGFLAKNSTLLLRKDAKHRKKLREYRLKF